MLFAAVFIGCFMSRGSRLYSCTTRMMDNQAGRDASRGTGAVAIRNVCPGCREASRRYWIFVFIDCSVSLLGPCVISWQVLCVEKPLKPNNPDPDAISTARWTATAVAVVAGRHVCAATLVHIHSITAACDASQWYRFIGLAPRRRRDAGAGARTICKSNESRTRDNARQFDCSGYARTSWS